MHESLCHQAIHRTNTALSHVYRVIAVPRRVISTFLHQAGIVGPPGIARQQHQNSQIYNAQLPAGQPVSAVHQSGQHVLPLHCLPAAHPRPIPHVLGHNCGASVLCPVHQRHQGMQGTHIVHDYRLTYAGELQAQLHHRRLQASVP